MDILFFAAIAIFLGWRLYSVLGQRIGHDKPPAMNPKSAAQPEEIPMQQKRAPAARMRAVRVSDRAKGGLDRLAELEPNFNTSSFMEGARIAREMILEAFAKEDLASLKNLLTPELYQTFASAIEDRRQQKQRLEYQFIGISESEIDEVQIENNIARIDVRFTTEHSQALYDEQGNVIEGDMKYVDRITDIWSFTRAIGSPNPNWQLAATEEI